MPLVACIHAATQGHAGAAPRVGGRMGGWCARASCMLHVCREVVATSTSACATLVQGRPRVIGRGLWAGQQVPYPAGTSACTAHQSIARRGMPPPSRPAHANCRQPCLACACIATTITSLCPASQVLDLYPSPPYPHLAAVGLLSPPPPPALAPPSPPFPPSGSCRTSARARSCCESLRRTSCPGSSRWGWWWVVGMGSGGRQCMCGRTGCWCALRGVWGGDVWAL